MTEDEAVTKFIDHLVPRRATLLGRVWGKGHGIDAAIRCIDSGLSLAIEAKRKAPSRRAAQYDFDNAFARLPQIAAGLKNLRVDGRVEQAGFRPDLVAIVLPWSEESEEHSRAFLEPMERLAYGLYWVYGDGGVRREI